MDGAGGCPRAGATRTIAHAPARLLLASALGCAGAGGVLGSILSCSLQGEALNAENRARPHYMDGVMHPLLVRHGRLDVP